MFCKLNKSFDKPLYAVINQLKTFTGEEDKGIDYRSIWSPDSEKIYSVIPKRYWKDFHLTLMMINREIPPHTDTQIITTINFYLETGGDNVKTIFFEPIVDNPKTIQIHNQTDGHIYFKDDLKEVDSFTANPFDIWLLDVKKIHSVEGNITGVRKAVTLGTFVHKYDDVIEMFKETGCLPS
jgi:hypothetical protein